MKQSDDAKDDCIRALNSPEMRHPEMTAEC